MTAIHYLRANVIGSLQTPQSGVPMVPIGPKGRPRWSRINRFVLAHQVLPLIFKRSTCSQIYYLNNYFGDIRRLALPMDINELTYTINGAVFEVNKVLGAGFLEKVYENALLIELRSRGLRADSQVPIKVYYKDQVVGEYTADILVEEKVILELKTVEKLDKIHEAQLLNYLRATGIKIGILVNFKHAKAEIKRMVLDLPEKSRV